MTEKEKRTILDMRAAGKQYKEISAVLGIEESSFRVERELVSAGEFERRFTEAVRATSPQEKL